MINKNVFDYVPVDIFWHSNFGGYFQDNWICYLGMVHNIAMGLCADSIVEHRESISHPSATDREYFDMKQEKIFNNTKREYAQRERVV